MTPSLPRAALNRRAHQPPGRTSLLTPPPLPGAMRGAAARRSWRAWAPAGSPPGQAPRRSAHPAWPAGSLHYQSTCGPAVQRAHAVSQSSSCELQAQQGSLIEHTRLCLTRMSDNQSQQLCRRSTHSRAIAGTGPRLGQELLFGLQRAVLGLQQRFLLLLHRPRSLHARAPLCLAVLCSRITRRSYKTQITPDASDPRCLRQL